MNTQKLTRIKGNWKPAAEDMTDQAAIDHFVSVYSLLDWDEFSKLFTLLREYATRDHRKGVTKTTILIDREDAKDRAEKIIKAATKAYTAIGVLRKEASEFEPFLSNPVLLEAVFRVDVGPPSQLLPPAELEPIFGLFDDRFWQDVEKRLRDVSAIPKPRRPPARMAHRTLGLCVAACRPFWESLGETWRRDGIGDDPRQLTGDCERFVSDVLRSAGMDFTLQDLSAAMGKC